ncbi:MAG: tricarballylate utilization 4Fe-4S protein TcuB [Aestuariivita sp.]|nr:tricarballylate utilization 4Fe-4S protein TcuB [Aestuariivita sp.]MCY4203023.1 tricarballylate utilization 4Fe-4S protein TcuB [Aestuariivita sp.]
MCDNPYAEAQRQIQICNSCRYCEGYCSAFSSITQNLAFADGDITQISHLCHNCRSCYYACQYVDPHEFAINLPQALDEVRSKNYEAYAWPSSLAVYFHRRSEFVVSSILLGIVVVALVSWLLTPTAGVGFYSVMSHATMLALFLPVFIIPCLSLTIGVRAYWRDVGGERVALRHVWAAVKHMVSLRNLRGGHGDGCNFERRERFTMRRRYAHQAIFFGFLLCFAATASGTVLHYVFDRAAPYPLISVPKLFGITGGVLLVFGCAWMLKLKAFAAKELSDPRHLGADNAVIWLLGLTSLSGLALYALGNTTIMPVLLIVHLGLVMGFFVITAYSKMSHGLLRGAALLRDAQCRDSDRNGARFP